MRSSQIVALILVIFSIEGLAQVSKDSVITKNIGIFSSVYRKVLETYPNPIDADTFLQSGINPMMETVDPFSKFFSQSDVSGMKQKLTGKFGGVGVVLQDTEEGVEVIEIFANSPAEKAGINVADQIININGISLKNTPFDDVFGLLRGEPGSEINITIKRSSSPKEISLTLKRAIISLSAVSYCGMLNGEVAYLKLRIESKGCAKEVEDALTAIYKKHKIKGLVFDLRNNEGGYMGEAIKIANLFVTKGNLLLKTRTKEKDTAYYAIKEAIYPVVPMVVLINNQTISSGEILSGAIQDNDRAVFIGQKSYGKGLIQEIFDMPEKTQLMLTTGSYFTPSGRCIQAFDYQHGIKNIADSLKTSFKTKNGRTVYNIGGISPDIETLYRKPSELKESLLQDNVISDFAADYKLRHPSIPSVKVFHIQVEDYDNFVAFAKTRKTDYKTDTDNKLNNLKESAIKEGLWEAIKPGYELVENNLAVQKEKDFIIHKTEIEDALEEEIVSRYYFKEGRFQSVLSKDTEVQKAIEILMKPMDYNKILNIKN